MRRKFKEMKDLILRAVNDMGKDHQQYHYVNDIFETYFKEHVTKMQSIMADKLEEIEDEFLFILSQELNKYGQGKKKVEQLEAVVNTCNSKGFEKYKTQLLSVIGSNYEEMEMYTKSYSYFVRAGNHVMAMKMMNFVMRDAYSTEYDLFVTRLCFEFIIRHKE